MCKGKERGINSSFSRSTAQEGVLPKGDTFLANVREIGQLGLIEKCLSTDKHRGRVYSMFR